MGENNFVIAIDFGTAYSGLAFNIAPSGEEGDITVKTWGEEVALLTPKTPTCILFDENEEFISFGYKAKVDYLSKNGQEGRKKIFFDCFKMALYGKKINSDLMIKAANGKSMKALKVFTEALRFLKENALKTINSNVKGRKFIPSDFTWVLTVPAIWDLSAKKFMREAAVEAGIVSVENEDKLVIALEPEAASVWCKKLPAKGFISPKIIGKTLDQSPGTQYIVVDCGGGTIDITVHEVLDGGALKELHKASGNNMGGQTVDRKFKEFLQEIFCDKIWDEYEKMYPSEVQKIMYDFTLFKKKDEQMEFTVSLNFGNIVSKKKKTFEELFKAVQGASYDEGAIVITKEKLSSFFEESLNGICKSLDDILKEDYKIEYILLVGGYADSEILQKYINDKYNDKCRVLCPFRPQEAIVKGAVTFGRNPEVVTSRKSSFTYGLAISLKFDESKHSEDRKCRNIDGEWCRDIFMKLVEIGEDVGWNQSKNVYLSPTVTFQKIMENKFYRTKKKNPMYVDEEEVELIGSFFIESPNTGLDQHHKTKLNIQFGFTEMKATATNCDSDLTKSIELEFVSEG